MFVNMNEEFGDTIISSDQLLSFGLGGLRNIGNTCYMNAALQALSNCSHLTYLKTRVSQSDSACQIWQYHVIRTVDLFSFYLSSFRPRCFNANTILDTFCIVHPMFRGYAQQDAQEFLRLFLVQLHEELKHSRLSNSDKKGIKQTTTTGSSDNSNNSIITDVFQGRLVSSVRCMSCSRLSNREESFMDLSLSLTKPTVQTYSSSSVDQSAKSSLMNGSISTGSLLKNGPVYLKTSNDLQQTLPSKSTSRRYSTPRGSKIKSSLFTLPSVVGRLVTGIPWLLTMLLTLTHIFLSYVQSFLPSRCNGLKQFRLVALPEILTLHLKRFSSNHLYSSKLSSPVNFPLKNLDLSPYLHRDCTDKITTYDLIGVICHYGGCGGGHYTTCAYNSSTEHWYEFNDEHVRKLDAEQVESLKSSAYILFYRKRDTHLEPIRNSWQLTPSGKMCYVSKPWVVRFWTWAEPGPMTSEFFCEHGYFRPELWEMRNSLTLSIPESIWCNLHKMFGGHEIIQELIPCSDCSDAISKRQKYELSEIMRVSSSVTPSSTSYAVSKKWLDVWLQFVKGQTWEAPGPIDNSDIMPCNKSLYSYRNSGSFNYPTLSSIPLGNYECVSAEVWSLLFNIYGGGPTISVCQPTYSSSINNSIDENQMDDLSDHSSSDQFSQKCSSNSTPNEQSPLNSDRIDEKDRNNYLTNGNNHMNGGISNNLDWSNNKSHLNHWSQMDKEINSTNLPIDSILSNGTNDDTIHHIEMYTQQNDHPVKNKLTQSTECSQLNGDCYPSSCKTLNMFNGCSSIVTDSKCQLNNHHSNVQQKSTNNGLTVSKGARTGYFGDYNPLDLVNHKNVSKVES
ncbi:unnamed protein product [Schistosoma margrebowiei]|uniref:Ubiquitin carboxyl-terminal hydrolase n=1 Tax=Schistosoma margrebowiei TaxID=48269 RepID=A0A183MKB1_9TREM|nr:unnamed protein product [Schistosoma margrebowiei]